LPPRSWADRDRASEEAERRFQTAKIPNCAVTSYEYDEGARRLVLADSGRVFWTDATGTAT
jgi:hypothetical protein